MSGSFIFGVPVGLGFLSVWIARRDRVLRWYEWIPIPWVSSMAFLLATLLLAWEGLICIVLWIPLIMVLSFLGGLLAVVLHRFLRVDRTKTYCAAFVVLLPFVMGPIENLKERSFEVRRVHSSILIHAPVEAVWNQIKSVPLITEDEHRFDVIHLLGFPRPLEARLEGEGVGSVRYATFEGGVLFVETVTEWIVNEKIAFSIDADTENIPSDTFDEHVIIGGPYFDVLRGSYEIERIDEGAVILHLYSDQRLSTNFNFYSHLWTEWLMKRLQDYILEIVQKRSETSLPETV